LQYNWWKNRNYC